MNGFRAATGGRVDRSRVLRFEFDGREYTGFAGDTLASALLANGVHLVGRSFKYHRPRGILSAGSDEPNALVTVWRDAARYTPNLLATQVELYDGLKSCSQNRWPSLAFDVGAVNGWLSRFIPAGFYYKTFMWPRSAWHRLYEPAIRRSAGLGIAPTESDPDTYQQRFAHCETLVVGSGPAGLAAALAAAATGGRVILCEAQPAFGGSLRGDSAVQIDGQSADEFIAASLATLRANPRVTLLNRTTVFGYFPHNSLGLLERLSDHEASPAPGTARERLWQVRAGEVIVAAGAHERPLVFPDNDRPGILLASAAHRFLVDHGVLPGRSVAVLTAHDSAWPVACALKRAGADVVAVCDTRTEVAAAVQAEARALGLRIVLGATAIGTRGRQRISAVRIARVAADGALVEREWLGCDALLMSGGWTPSLHLHSQSRGKLRWDDSLLAYLPGEAAERSRCLGACAGEFDLAALLKPFGHRVAGAAHFSGGRLGLLPQIDADAPKAFVDWQNDVTSNDLKLAMREGFRSIEHIKRYTTTGMATDQGKTSNLNALGLVSAELRTPVPGIGLTTFRPPYTPVTFGSFAGSARGQLFDPVRTTPMHHWAERQGAVFEDVGLWKRARFFPRGEEDMHAAVARECLAVRKACGVFDASTLGKIEVVGPDAAEFLNRLYVNDWSTLAPGRSKYGILLRDDGFVYDDGVIARLAADRFHVTTTTGGAPRVLAMMEDYLQTEWQELKVWLTSTTEQWAVIAVQGPKAREVLRPLVEGIDLSPTALPHMGAVTGRICGVPTRLFRVSFTGELGYEINVPADHGLAVLEAVYESGKPHGITPYGTETMHVLRAEKGYIIVGQDTDGSLSPFDAGVAWAIGKKKPDYVGKRSLQRPAMLAEDRPHLVGLLTRDPRTVLEEGAQIAERAGQQPPMQLVGHVTSSYWSSTLQRSIALGVVRGGRARMGQSVYVPMPSGDIETVIANPVFVDPKGERLNG